MTATAWRGGKDEFFMIRIRMTRARQRATGGMLLAALAGLPRVEAVASGGAPGLPPGVAELTTTWEAPPSPFARRESTAAPLLGNGSLAVCFGGPAEALRFFINRNDFWRLSDNNQGKQKLAALLDLNMPDLAGASYRLDQAIRDGTVTGTFVKGELTVRLTCRLMATEDVLMVDLCAEGGETPVDLALTAPAEAPSDVESGGEGDLLWVSRTFAKEVDISTQAATAVRVLGAAGMRFTLQSGVPVTLAVFSSSAFDAPDPLAAVRERAAAWTPDRLARLRAGHADWWRDYWNRSWVTMDDPVLMKGYYQGLYTLAAASRNPRFPPGIFGPWITDDQPNWSNDYHLNYNFVAPFYGLYSANRLEQADPQDAPLLAFMPRGQVVRGTRDKNPRRALSRRHRARWAWSSPRASATGPSMAAWSRAARFIISAPTPRTAWSTSPSAGGPHRIPPMRRRCIRSCARWRSSGRTTSWRWTACTTSMATRSTSLSGANKNPILTLGLLRNAFDLVLDLSRALNRTPIAARRGRAF
jgi:alpha-L-fucosidase 2